MKNIFVLFKYAMRRSSSYDIMKQEGEESVK